MVRAAGPIDPEVGLMLVQTADGERPLGVLTNFALHLDTVGRALWSADYPYYVERALRDTLGAHVISLFGNGCCGDINHVDPRAETVNKTDLIGQSLGQTVVQGLAKLVPYRAAGVAYAHRTSTTATARDLGRRREAPTATGGGCQGRERKVDFFGS